SCSATSRRRSATSVWSTPRGPSPRPNGGRPAELVRPTGWWPPPVTPRRRKRQRDARGTGTAAAPGRRRMAHQPTEVLPVADGASAEDLALVDRLRAGDGDAFAEIVDGWSSAMLRVARSFVSTHASAEDVVQETWLAVVRGLDRFEGRSSLRTWVFRILSNQAKTRGVRDARTVTWSSPAPDPGGPPAAPD